MYVKAVEHRHWTTEDGDVVFVPKYASGRLLAHTGVSLTVEWQAAFVTEHDAKHGTSGEVRADVVEVNVPMSVVVMKSTRVVEVTRRFKEPASWYEDLDEDIPGVDG